jgi:large subunit ribosomal protein L10
MDNPRAEKVAVVNEVRDRLQASDAAVLTEYRGLTVAALADLRRELAAAGGDYKIYKNTLVRLAVADGPQAPIRDLLTGPTAIAFVQGDVSAVAKALREFARSNPNLVVKGGMVGTGLLSAADMSILAELPSRETLLAQFAGALSAPLQQLAGLVQALPRNLAYGLSALIEQRQAGGETLPEEPEATAPAAEDVAESPATDEPSAQAEAPRNRGRARSASRRVTPQPRPRPKPQADEHPQSRPSPKHKPKHPQSRPSPKHKPKHPQSRPSPKHKPKPPTPKYWRIGSGRGGRGRRRCRRRGSGR